MDNPKISIEKSDTVNGSTTIKATDMNGIETEMFFNTRVQCLDIYIKDKRNPQYLHNVFLHRDLLIPIIKEIMGSSELLRALYGSVDE